MEPITTHTGIGAPLRRSNVDTDQIIPAEYLKRVTRTGFEDGLFSSWRGGEPDFSRTSGPLKQGRPDPCPARLPRGREPR